MNVVFLSLGSNLGNRTKMLKLAIHRLSTFSVVEKISTFIETKPQGVKEKQPKYINAVVKITTPLSSSALLDHLMQLEKDLGRDLLEKGLKKSRSIDIDILSFNDEVIETKMLTIPHPFLHKRDFVLVPLAEIDPEWVHPILKKSSQELLDKIMKLSKE